jgi:hypothetical protein
MTLEITPANEPYMNPTTSSPRTPTPFSLDVYACSAVNTEYMLRVVQTANHTRNQYR